MPSAHLETSSDQLLAGVAKVAITDERGGPANDPLYAKALVLQYGATKAVVATVDAVAIAEIGSIRNEFLAAVRGQLQADLGIDPGQVLINASHCHGRVCADIEARVVQAVKLASAALVPVRVGVGTGREDRIGENRRLKLRNGREADVRRAYALPPDEEVVAVGPIDPQIGVLRLDRADGSPLAVVYNYAVHPILGVPSGENTADLTGFASQIIEDQLGQGVVALFLQGCGADINPVWYKDTSHPSNAEILGQMLALSTLQAFQEISTCESGPLQITRQMVELPRADLAASIAALRSEQQAQLRALKGTQLNLKAFIPLLVKYRLAPEYPSYDSHRYLHEEALGRRDLAQLDADNRRHLEAYIANIHTMEQLPRIQTNLELLEKHQARYEAAAEKSVEVEVVGLRVSAFFLVTFPGELPVQIGLDIKRRSPHPHTFVAGVSNGYLYYTPTVEQMVNRGGAQEDSDCLLASEWQAMFEAQVAAVLQELG